MNEHRRLYGLNEFTGTITSLAMQKPGTDVRKRILPDHVFQLQCIVDSLTVSRGWSLHFFEGHVLKAVPRDFKSRRDVDLLLDRDNKREGHGYLQALHILQQVLEKDTTIYDESRRNQHMSEVMVILREEFVNWLGESKYKHGLKNVPPSRFSNSNTNGL